jgi:carbon dioxide concentrating mechanism protein CcmN
MSTQLRSLARELVPVHLYGTVSIDPTAVIAPGVLLQAEANSHITIGPGVCIGAGTIIQAAGGMLEIGAGACLGREVLAVGRGWIGANACVGAGTTAIDPQIPADTVVAAASLVGDRSRDGAVAGQAGLPPPAPVAPPQESVVQTPEDDILDAWDDSASSTASAIEPKATSPPVAGRAQFELLKKSLFPHSGNP